MCCFYVLLLDSHVSAELPQNKNAEILGGGGRSGTLPKFVGSLDTGVWFDSL